MFYDADAFNQDIGSWDVSKGTDFVSVVTNTDISFVFINASC